MDLGKRSSHEMPRPKTNERPKLTKVEEVHAMGEKRAMTKKYSQGKEKGESSRKCTRPWCKIGIFDFSMGEYSNPSDLV